MSAQQADIVLKLRTLARKAFITFREQDAARLREAADELERLRAENKAMSAHNALTEIARLAANGSPWFAGIARAALEGKK
jgi:hypothetical protein